MKNIKKLLVSILCLAMLTGRSSGSTDTPSTTDETTVEETVVRVQQDT